MCTAIRLKAKGERLNWSRDNVAHHYLSVIAKSNGLDQLRIVPPFVWEHRSTLIKRWLRVIPSRDGHAMNQSFNFKHYSKWRRRHSLHIFFSLGSSSSRYASCDFRVAWSQIQKLKSFQNDRQQSPLPPVFRPWLRAVPVQLGLKFQKRLLEVATKTQNILGSWQMPSLEVREKSIKHQYHSIGKQLHVWWRSEFVVGGPACPSGTSREAPCRQGCNLTASQHSFEMSFLRMAVPMPHLVLHDKYQVMRSLDAEAARQRLLEPDPPKSGRTLIDCPIDTVLLL